MSVDPTCHIQTAIAFAEEKNPIWPFSAVLVDEHQKIICKATDCAHISPLFHAETLAIHALVTKLPRRSLGALALYTTAEPDAMSQSAIHWANLVHNLDIQTIYFGSKLSTIQTLWPFGIDIPAQEIIDRSCSTVQLQGPLLEAATDALFLNAKKYQAEINKAHPAQGNLSNQLSDFYELTV